MKAIVFNYIKLEKRVIDIFGSQENFVREISMDKDMWLARIAGNSFFDQAQIEEICQLLEIHSREIGSYFFNSKIKKTVQREIERRNDR
ncbi:DUF739 family protein [Enterococcus sp. BWM-S5]|uniref:DUF739 family protein n=1 Tax=Enterococcus larvae TaxID=2794352 RepID=A0ABS4CEP9_9ENTE|nr:DUF739 family protein [Enterococcus larvae]MBP1045104.1 DUF739 family protein [Enterococcus larvae]